MKYHLCGEKNVEKQEELLLREDVEIRQKRLEIQIMKVE
jgi:hypothetical protein